MPQFASGETRTAIAAMSNPTGKTFGYTTELYLGLPKAASSGAIPFSLAAGETKNIPLLVTMPDVEGTYPVYLDVFVAGQLIGTYKAVEDVAIAPLYKASVSFRRERVCMTSRGTECLQYYPYERRGTVTVTNQGAPGEFTTKMQGYTHWASDYYEHKQCTIHGDIASGEWTDYLATGQTRAYYFNYMVGSTGMPIDSRFFIRAYDPNGELIAEVDYILPL